MRFLDCQQSGQELKNKLDALVQAIRQTAISSKSKDAVSIVLQEAESIIKNHESLALLCNSKLPVNNCNELIDIMLKLHLNNVKEFIRNKNTAFINNARFHDKASKFVAFIAIASIFAFIVGCFAFSLAISSSSYAPLLVNMFNLFYKIDGYTILGSISLLVFITFISQPISKSVISSYYNTKFKERDSYIIDDVDKQKIINKFNSIIGTDDTAFNNNSFECL